MTSGSADVPKLTEACIQSLIADPADPRKLYDLSTDELVALNTTLLTDHKAVKQELAELKRRRYHVDPPVSQDRVGREVRQKAEQISGRWAAVPPSDVASQEMASTSNMRWSKGHSWIQWDASSGKASLTESEHLWGRELRPSSVISSALLLYRLCCLFDCQVDVEGPQGHKVVWSVYLQHKSSRHYVGFSEWKGSALFRASKFPPTGTAFDEDWLDLLNLLLDPQCPHPYDGTVAGSVA